MEKICGISGKSFAISEHEMSLREKFGFGETLPTVCPRERFKQLGAFWPMWALHKRTCDKTGKTIISIFDKDCKYPVWHRDEWVAHNDPPSRDFDFSRPFFEQALEVFKKSPLPHNFQSNNINCEYTDDWYHSKNCYLCHSGEYCEDLRYCYGCDHLKDSHSCVFAFSSELCFDSINVKNCFNGKYLLNCKNVHDSSFLYDCRDCHDCLFCFNLRNKQYCFANQQLTKEEFEKKKAEWDFTSIDVYEHAKKYFEKMMTETAWHRAVEIDRCENTTGCYVRDSKDCENCYMLSKHENCANVSFSGPDAKTTLDALGTVGTELSYMCSLPVYSYFSRLSFSVDHCRYVDYCAYLQNCQYCFGCCGLFGRKYCILNKQYSKEEYEELVPRIVEHMKGGSIKGTENTATLRSAEWGTFFPEFFPPNPYEESYSGYHFPRPSINPLLDRPFEIQKGDIEFAKKIKGPLPNSYYIKRIQDNFKWMPFAGELRKTHCAHCKSPTETNWPENFDARILCEDCYLKLVK